MVRLGVNIDHVATLREARGECDPDPITAAKICENAGVNSIVCHLREDRRHINDKDLINLKNNIRCRLNLEMALDMKIVKIACKIMPDCATIVPEKRQELTTEGGLNVIKNFSRIKKVVKLLQKKNIEVSLFVDPIKNQIKKAKNTNAEAVELHTGRFDLAKSKLLAKKELNKIKDAAKYAHSLGLSVAAGHGLKYHNAKTIAQIPEVEELNIGHSMISRSIFIGLGPAVKEMLYLIN